MFLRDPTSCKYRAGGHGFESPNSHQFLWSRRSSPDLDVRVQPGKSGGIGCSRSMLAPASLRFSSVFLLPESAQSLLGRSNVVLGGFVDVAVSYSKNTLRWEALLFDPLTSDPFDWCQEAGAHPSVRSEEKGQKNITLHLAHSSLGG